MNWIEIIIRKIIKLNKVENLFFINEEKANFNVLISPAKKGIDNAIRRFIGLIKNINADEKSNHKKYFFSKLMKYFFAENKNRQTKAIE